VDISAQLDELTALVEGARAMPMSASCIVNRAEVLEAVEALRAALPSEITSARDLLDERSAVVEEGRVQAQQIIDDAIAERDKLVARTQVVKAANREAQRLVDEAQEETDRMRVEVDDYVDAKLANFEIILRKTLGAVEHGRDKISGRNDELEALSDPSVEVEPLPS
jgi:cell division septum initiation protein DivIVA